MCYKMGDGVAQCYKRAAALFQKAATKDFPLANYHLGLSYAQGTGVEQSYKRAAELFQRAAEQAFTDGARGRGRA